MNKREAILFLEKKRDKAIGDMSFFGEGSRKGLMNEIRVNTYDIAINTLQQIDEPLDALAQEYDVEPDTIREWLDRGHKGSFEKAEVPEKVEARLAEHWNEDVGDVLWWNFPVEEPPYCGTPLDEHFPKYKTHFSMIDMPNEIEQPKRWVVKFVMIDAVRYFSKFNGCKGLDYNYVGRKENAHIFTDRAKAEAVAVLVEGEVEEV